MDLQIFLVLGVLSFDVLNVYINNLLCIFMWLVDMCLFQEDGLVGIIIVKVGIKGIKLVLVLNVLCGVFGQFKGLECGKVKLLEIIYLLQNLMVMVDQLLGVYDLVDLEGVNVVVVVNVLQVVYKCDLDFIIEYYCMGVLQGKLFDVDGLVIIDFYDEFGVVQIVFGMELNKDVIKVCVKCMVIKCVIEDKLGGVLYIGIYVFCSVDFFDVLIDYLDVQKVYECWQDGVVLCDDVCKGFVFGDIIFEELQGNIGGDLVLVDGEVIVFLLGVLDMFLICFVLVDYLEMVCGIGLLYYIKIVLMCMNKGIQLESQFNLFNINI